MDIQAKKTFQAIRIELNHELDVLKNNLEDMIDILDDEGRIADHYVPFFRRPHCKEYF